MTEQQNDTGALTARAQIAGFLPRALGTAIKSYDNFLSKKQGETKPEDFKAHHDACKVALAHIELLVRLAKWVETAEDGAGAPDAALAALIAQAREDVAESERR